MKRNLVWLILGISIVVGFAAIVMQSTSTRVLYASQMGCALNSDVYNGGGTDDSVALQAGINLATVKGYKFIVDGPALISTNIILPSNTKLEFLPGAGFFMAPHANCWVLGNAQNTNYSTTNIVIHGGILNCNGNAQAEYVTNGFHNSGAPGVWGVWFAGVDGVIMRDTKIMSSKAYALLFSDSRNGLFENITCQWTNNVAGTNTYYGTDSFHSQGNVTNVHVNGLTSIQGHDDVIALMTDETSLTLNVNDPRWTINSGAMKDILIENVYLDKGTGQTAGYPRTFSKFQTQGGTNAILENVTIRNVHGTFNAQGLVSLAPTDTYLRAKNLRIDGFHVDLPSGFDASNPVGMIALASISADTVLLNDIGINDSLGAGGIISGGYLVINSRITNSLISNVYVQGSAGSVANGDVILKVLSDPYQSGQVNTNSPRVSLVNVTAKSMAGVISDDGGTIGVVRMDNIQTIGTPAINTGSFTNIFIMPTNQPTSGQAITATGTSGQTAWASFGAPTITYTNLVSGLVYHNLTGRPQQIIQGIVLTEAVVTGAAEMSFYVDPANGTAWGKTNRITIGTTLSTPSDQSIEQLIGIIPIGASYIITNTSRGAGNGATMDNNQTTGALITY